ncbi:tetratricopeptide repeat protein [Algoriphagus litoralis]|uniref:tetratricopeptide repeat protein n=1 Tax=Algoriphagus litoralis TaxID=2202829 RepID=UPI000DBA9C3B|nr:tetratricopeptide repeat protein [Algoriphagus litoralis]
MNPTINSPLSQDDFELIEGFLNGTLPSDQLEEVQTRIASDPAFAFQVEQIRELQVGIQRASLAAKLDSFHTELSYPEKETPIKSIRPLWFWGVAASVFLVMSAGVWWIMGQKSPEEQLYQAYFRPDPGLVTTMSGDANYEFDRAMVAYKEGDYADAIARWENLLSAKPESDTLNYFLGSAYLSSQQESRSLSYLEAVAEDLESAFYSEANWYAGLAAMKLGQNEKALIFLNASSRPQAQQLISELESN